LSVMNICKLEKSTWTSKDISLRQPCRELTQSDIESSWLRNLLDDMYETLYATSSGVGLAAPQVGIQLKLVVIDIKRDTKKPLVLINPSYTGIGTQMKTSSESCLSVPGVVGQVMRYEQILLTYTNLQGERIEKEYSGFEAKAIQHEVDHTNGILYVDRLVEGTRAEPSEGHIRRLAVKAVDNVYTKAGRNVMQ